MIWREPELGIANPEYYLDIASSDVRAAYALREDLLAVLFPHGAALPTELLQSCVKLKLQALVVGVERSLNGDDRSGESGGTSWEALARTGLFREKELIDFALARVAEDRLQKRLSESGYASMLAQLPTALLAHENGKIAQMATALLRAEQYSLSDNQLFRRLNPAQLHLLCSRIVAALQEADGSENPERVSRAQALLQAHDGGGADPATIARKLVFFLGPDLRSDLLNPRKAGLHLFFAGLEQDFGLPTDMLFRLIGEASVVPLLLFLKASDLPSEQLPSILTALRWIDDNGGLPDAAAIYEVLDRVDARAQIAVWAAEMSGAT
jgi:hypothetical protein